MKYNYTIEELKQAVATSKNFCEVCNKLGIKKRSYFIVKKKILKFNLSTKHFSLKKEKQHAFKKCKHCGKEFEIKNKYIELQQLYCSKSCSNSGEPRKQKIFLEYLNLADKIVNLYSNKKTITEICEQLNLRYSIVRDILKYKNIKLRSVKNFTKQEKIERLKTSLERFRKEKQYQSVRVAMRNILLFEKGNVCDICKNTTWNNQPIPLTCDHIDGNHENMEDNNFRLICPNCDRQLPTFGSRNIVYQKSE